MIISEVMAVKRSSILLYSLAALAVCTILFFHSGFFQRQSSIVLSSSEKSMSSYFTSKAPSSQGSTGNAQTLASRSEVYIVKAYNGHIGVFHGGDSKPFQEYKTDVALLPKADQQSLEKGKVMYSMADVEKLMEDYDN